MPTPETNCSKVFCETMNKTCEPLYKALYFLKTGWKVPWPPGQQENATRVGELLQFGFRYIGELSTDSQNILVLKDDVSG